MKYRRGTVKPLETKTLKIRTCRSRVHFVQCFGPKSSTKRSDGKDDIILQFDGKSFKAHKEVMREASELFEKEPAFQKTKPSKGSKDTKQFCEYDLNAANVLPKGCKTETLDEAIDFAYTGRLPNFPAKEWLNFFRVAVALRFPEALDAYFNQFKHIYHGTSTSRLLSTKAAANLLSESQKIRKSDRKKGCAGPLENIFDGTSKYLLKEPIDKLISDKDFLQDMSADGMEAFLDRDDLAKPEEEIKVLDLALAWIKYDKKDREKHAKKVLRKVHLGLLPRDLLTELCIKMTSWPCKDMIDKVVKLMDSKDDVSVPLEYTHHHWFGTRSEMFCDTLVGFNPGAQAMVYFNPYGPNKGWQHWCDYQAIMNPPMKYRNYKSSVLSVNGKLFMAGGCQYRKMSKISASGRLVRGYKYWNIGHVFEGNVGVKSSQREEKDDYLHLHFINSWCQYPPMIDPRKSFPMVHLDGYLYAIGGEDNESEAMKEAERYSFKDKKWEKIADLPVPCYYACATVYKGKILVYGSQPVPDMSGPAKHDLQMFDPGTNQWQVVLTEHHVIAKYKEEEEWVDSDEENEEEGKEEEKVNEEGKDAKAKETDDKGKDGDHNNGGKILVKPDKKGQDWNSEQELVSDELEEVGIVIPKNVLMINGDDCFRVVYTAANACCCSYDYLKPVVHHLQFDFTGSAASVKVGKAESQKLVPKTDEEGTFQIRNKVYVNTQGCVLNTGIQITPHQKKKVDLGLWSLINIWEMLCQLDVQIQVANFRFDKKAVFCKGCIKGSECLIKKKKEDAEEAEQD